MRGETLIPEIAGLWPEGPVAGLQLIAPPAVRPGEQIEVRLTILNRKAGHNFITGPLDFIRSWVHLRAYDRAGRLLAEWGSVDPETRRIEDSPGQPHEIGNRRDEGTLVLESLPVDEHGNLLREHELWRKAGGRGQRVIFPRHSDSHRYRLRVPMEVTGSVTLRADLNYRRYRQEFLDLVVPGLEESSGVYQPTVTQASVWRVIEIAGPQKGAGAAGG